MLQCIFILMKALFNLAWLLHKHIFFSLAEKKNLLFYLVLIRRYSYCWNINFLYDHCCQYSFWLSSHRIKAYIVGLMYQLCTILILMLSLVSALSVCVENVPAGPTVYETIYTCAIIEENRELLLCEVVKYRGVWFLRQNMVVQLWKIRQL